METNTILLFATLCGTIWLFLYGLKRILDAETFQILTNKIVAYILKAENEITGLKKGPERLDDVVKNITATATKAEKKLLQKLNLPNIVSGIFTSVVTPILLKKVR